MSNDNLELWNAVQETNPADTKEVSFGRKFTAIDAYSQIKKATEQFGEYGDKWGLTEVDYIFIHDSKIILVKGRFKHPNGEFPVNTSISSVMGQKEDDDFAKKAETDLITKALSRLGFNADIFMGKFDDQKYVQEMTKKFQQIDTKPIRQKYVDRAVEVYRECVEADVEEIDSQKMKDVDALLSNDERIEVMNVLKPLGKMEGTNRAYTTIVNECLKAHPADNEQVEK
jgi:hypothetical protein